MYTISSGNYWTNTTNPKITASVCITDSSIGRTTYCCNDTTTRTVNEKKKIKEAFAYSIEKLREQREKEFKIALENSKKRSTEADDAFKRDLLKYKTTQGIKAQNPEQPAPKQEIKPPQKVLLKLENIVLEHDPVALDRFLDDEPKIENPPDAGEPQAYGSFLENESEDPLAASAEKLNSSTLNQSGLLSASNNNNSDPKTKTPETDETAQPPPKKLVPLIDSVSSLQLSTASTGSDQSSSSSQNSQETL